MLNLGFRALGFLVERLPEAVFLCLGLGGFDLGGFIKNCLSCLGFRFFSQNMGFMKFKHV